MQNFTPHHYKIYQWSKGIKWLDDIFDYSSLDLEKPNTRDFCVSLKKISSPVASRSNFIVCKNWVWCKLCNTVIFIQMCDFYILHSFFFCFVVGVVTFHEPTQCLFFNAMFIARYEYRFFELGIIINEQIIDDHSSLKELLYFNNDASYSNTINHSMLIWFTAQKFND